MSADRSREATDPRVLSPAATAELLRGAPWSRLAVLGDSLAAGAGDPTPGYAALSWPERLVSALRVHRPGLAYLNTGVIGARTDEVLTGQLDRVVAFRPDLVGVLAGGNDLFAPDPDYDAIAARLDTIQATFRHQGADVFTVTVADIFEAHPALAEMRDRLMRLNDLVRTVAARNGTTVVEMWDNPVRRDPELMSADGIHFATLGHAVLTTEIVTTLGRQRTAPG